VKGFGLALVAVFTLASCRDDPSTNGGAVPAASDVPRAAPSAVGADYPPPPLSSAKPPPPVPNHGNQPFELPPTPHPESPPPGAGGGTVL